MQYDIIIYYIYSAYFRNFTYPSIYAYIHVIRIQSICLAFSHSENEIFFAEYLNIVDQLFMHACVHHYQMEFFDTKFSPLQMKAIQFQPLSTKKKQNKEK